MTKIVHEFCGICIQRRDIAGCFSGVWGGGLRFGEESCLCIAARLRGIACSWWGRVAGPNRSPPVRRREGRGTASLGAPAVFCIALCAIARHSLLGVGQGCGLNHSPPVQRREDRGTASLGAPAVFCIALRAIARHSRAGKKRQPSRATAAGRHAPFPVSYTIRLPAGSICARNIIPWFCPLRKYKKARIGLIGAHFPFFLNILKFSCSIFIVC